MSNVELYEALKKSLTKDAARMIAEVVPAARDLATKGDIVALGSEFAGLKAEFAELKAEFARLEALVEKRIGELETRLLRWTLAFFMPLWLAVLGTLWAVLLRM